MRRHLAIALLLSSTFAGAAHAGVLDLTSVMGNANLYSLGNFSSQWTDVEGAVLAGGSVYGDGHDYNLKNVDAFGSYAIVARNNITANGGEIRNGNVYAGGTVTLNNASGPTVSTGPAPVNFDLAAAYYLDLSKDLSKLAATGTIDRPYSTAILSGGSSGVDVFNVSSDYLQSFAAWDLSRLTAGQTLIFNVSGANASLRPAGIESNGLDRFNVVFNFYEATTADPRGIWGSVLAPKATVTADWGVVNGNVIVGNWDYASIQVNAGNDFKPVEVAGFRDPISPVPEPSTIGMLLAGLAAVALGRRRARK